ncbi:hypothetical protein PaecuDRAFT_1869 [Paenibacillus curdlanolyticus YK9]|uniref:Uncharacterized protein n=1 Tax=Paenibacillus curdlanolyticus YK9 TaxID=717606 RepID=E0I8B8_9BACL|nr:hypothetical protein PaecuDRAFT_1869 [Paenibacillus curdlanolyticus YK9]
MNLTYKWFLGIKPEDPLPDTVVKRHPKLEKKLLKLCPLLKVKM